MKDAMVFGFGCPRGGTTYLRELLAQSDDYQSVKIPEWSMMHPCNSAEGLIDLVKVFGDRFRVVLVQVVRHPMDIVRSFYFARETDPHSGLAQNSDRDIIGFIRNTWLNTMTQRLAIEKMRLPLFRGVTWQYGPGVAGLASALTAATDKDHGFLVDWHKRHFGKTPVREGVQFQNRLYQIPDDATRWFNRKLRDVIADFNNA